MIEIKKTERNLNQLPSLALIVPCYNESETIAFCSEKLNEILELLIHKKKIAQTSYILFVDDGSKDSTWEDIKQLSLKCNKIWGLKLSGNRGQQTAMIAGLVFVDVDINITIDADLQDNIACIEQMVEKYLQGAEIVYGVRNDRSNDHFLKRFTAHTFYSVMNYLGVNQIPNHSEFRLLSKYVTQCFLKYTEKNIYIRGIISSTGFKTDKVYYSRKKRFAGETKYSFWKLINLAIEAITSFSVIPLRIISFLGIFTCIFSVFAMIYSLLSKLYDIAIPGWTSTTLSIFFLCGVQLLSLGVIGEYIGKIYIEVKNRPRYFIEEMIKNKS